MPDFNPDKFLADTAPAKSGGFNPDKFLAETAPVPAEKTSPLESAARGYAQGLTFGHSDELVGAAKAGYKKLTGADEPLSDLYVKGRDEARAAEQKAKEDNPKTYILSNLGGAATTAFIPGLDLLTPVKGASIAANLGKAALVGGLSGEGYSNASPVSQPFELAKDTAKGAAIGAATQGVLEGVGRVAEKLSPSELNSFANERAVKAATGQNKAILKRIAKTKGFDETGETLLGGENPVVTFGSSVNTIRDKAADAADKAWDSVTNVYKAADQAAGGKAIDGSEIAQGIIDRAAKIEPLPQNESTINKMMETAAYLEKKGPLSLEEAQHLKNNFVFKLADPKTHALGLDGNNAIRDAFTDSMGQALKRADPALEASWKDAMKQYGVFATAAGAADERAVANVSNRFFSPTDYAMGIGAGAVSSIKNSEVTGLIGAASALAHKLARERGSSMAAVTAKNLASMLEQSPAVIGQAYPAVIQAAKAGPAALEALHEELLQKSPSYRQMLQPKTPSTVPMVGPDQNLKRDAIKRRLGE